MTFSPLIAPAVPSLLLSLKVAAAATAVCIVIGLPLAYWMAKRRFFLKPLVETLITLPLVLPPTVVGYLLLLLIGHHGPIGGWVYRWFGFSILFHPIAAIIAAAVVSMPLLYLPAKAAFATIDPEMEDVARLMGASRLSVFWQVAIPIARRGIFSGIVLVFARSLGEFGATVMVFGTTTRGMTLSMQVYFEYANGTPENALPAVIALVAMSLGVMFLYSRAGFLKRD